MAVGKIIILLIACGFLLAIFLGLAFNVLDNLKKRKIFKLHYILEHYKFSNQIELLTNVFNNNDKLYSFYDGMFYIKQQDKSNHMEIKLKCDDKYETIATFDYSGYYDAEFITYKWDNPILQKDIMKQLLDLHREIKISVNQDKKMKQAKQTKKFLETFYK